MGEDRVVAGERADAIPEAALRLADIAALLHDVEYDEDGEPTNVDGGFLSALDYALRGSSGCIEPEEWEARRRQAWAAHFAYIGLAAAAPLLPGGGEAEARLAGLRARNAMLEGEVERLRSARPDAETVARAVWDARETKDPSGERTGCTEDDEAREPVFWDQAVAEDRWPGSRRDQLEEARLVLDMLGRRLDARSGVDTVKLAEGLRELRQMVLAWTPDWETPWQIFGPLINDLLAEFASGADRPEGSQT